MKLKELTLKIPEFCLSHWLLRIPLIIANSIMYSVANEYEEY